VVYTGALAATFEARLSMLPRAQLGMFPTPLHPLPALGRLAGSEALYIKRDDLSGLGLGGNKVRSLEFLLGRAVADGADTIICGGGLQSNMCRLAAAASARLGMRCILIHNDDMPDFMQGNMLLNGLFGAESVFAGPIPESERDELCHEVARREAGRGAKPYIAEHGASTPLGAAGFAAGALEVLRQDIATGAGLRHLVIVGAMGGTAAGLIAGVGMLGAPYRVHVISVEYDKHELTSRLDQLISGFADILSQAGGTGHGRLPDLAAWDRYVSIYDEYLGPGYAVPTAESKRALHDAARLEAILCEPVYTSKTLAGCLDLIRGGVIGPTEGCCFWHTGGTAALFGLADQLQPQR